MAADALFLSTDRSTGTASWTKLNRLFVLLQAEKVVDITVNIASVLTWNWLCVIFSRMEEGSSPGGPWVS